jgi:succinoglycan biosynthesis transport protein ExoP
MQSTQYSEELDFQKYWLVLKRRWLPATLVFGLFAGLALAAAYIQKPVYEADGKLVFKQDRSSSLTGLKNDLGEIIRIGDKSEPLATEAEIVRSIPLLQRTLDSLGLKDDKGKPYEAKAVVKAKMLKVEPVTGTDVMQIVFKHNDPKIAAAVVNKLMEAYIEDNILNNRSKAKAARIFISEQLPRVEATVMQDDAALRKFKEENGVVALKEEAVSAVDNNSALEKQITTAQTKLADAREKSAALRKQLGLNSEQAKEFTAINQSPLVQEALAELQKVQAKLASERTRFTDTSPTVIALQEKEASLKALVQERGGEVLNKQQPAPVENLQMGALKQKLTADLLESEAVVSGLTSQLNILFKAQTAYKMRSQNLPKLEQNQRELERKLQASQSTYETLLNKLQEAQVSENQTVGNARIISAAQVPKKPSGPSKIKFLLGGSAAGLVLGLTTAFLLDMIDKSVKSLKEARELFGSTLLGVIPAYEKAGKSRYPARDSERIVPKIVARDLPGSPIAQAYQMLQANLKFVSSDKQLKAIVVTSSVPKEGKSQVSANLAAAMAQVGRRVLLVDADMRHPSQHHLWELTNSMGLSNVIVGEAEFNKVVKEVMPKLDVLTAGVIPPNPVALLDSKKMASLIENFSKNYDCVIIDTPPLAGIADAPILGKMADGILMVVRPKVVDSASANAAKEFLARSGQHVLGLVANGVIIKNEPDSYFYYSKEDYSKQDSPSQEQAKLVAGGDSILKRNRNQG